MEYKKITTEELEKMLSTTCEILEIFNTQGKANFTRFTTMTQK
jgi:hypothetical protein